MLCLIYAFKCPEDNKMKESKQKKIQDPNTHKNIYEKAYKLLTWKTKLNEFSSRRS